MEGLTKQICSIDSCPLHDEILASGMARCVLGNIVHTVLNNGPAILFSVMLSHLLKTNEGPFHFYLVSRLQPLQHETLVGVISGALFNNNFAKVHLIIYISP